jgi:aminoglycoside phosphotransferase (APT) family kinase protein
VPFLRLHLCSHGWLDQALPILLAASEAVVLAGDALMHLDVRSDNLCLRGGQAILIDWNWAVIGNPELDVAAWLPSLHAEGGPAPEEILPDHGPLAALLSGYWASRAGLPPIPDAPRVRELQLMQLRVALPWAARALGLPEPTPSE